MFGRKELYKRVQALEEEVLRLRRCTECHVPVDHYEPCDLSRYEDIRINKVLAHLVTHLGLSVVYDKPKQGSLSIKKLPKAKP